MIKEFCAENFTKIEQAINLGANRIELCDNLAGGGTTPSIGVIEQTLKVTQPQSVPVMVMIRPRTGNFVYTDAEFDIMKRDLELVKNTGAEGVVFGCLTANGRINRQQMTELIERADGMETVFHMAFDHIDDAYKMEELQWLITRGVTRLLTHGGIGGLVMDHRESLEQIIAQAGEAIEILLGGGVSYENIEEITTALDTQQVHGTRIVKGI